MPTGSTTAEAPPVAYEAIPRTEDEALTRLDEASTHLQQEGRYLEALECMEKGLILRHRMFGGRSAEVRALAEGCPNAGQAEHAACAGLRHVAVTRTHTCHRA